MARDKKQKDLHTWHHHRQKVPSNATTIRFAAMLRRLNNFCMWLAPQLSPSDWIGRRSRQQTEQQMLDGLT
jgi:hypothetical protein